MRSFVCEESVDWTYSNGYSFPKDPSCGKMLRHAISRKRPGIGLRKVEYLRFQSGGKPRQELRTANSAGKRSEPTRKTRSSIQRPDFLQSLRVQTNPLSKTEALAASKRKPQAATNLDNLLRQGPNPGPSKNAAVRPIIKEPFSKTKSATQSNLDGLDNRNPSDGIVNFFQRRLKEVKLGNEEKGKQAISNGEDGKLPPSSFTASGVTRSQSPHSNPRIQGGGLRAALREATMTQRNPESLSSSSTSGELSTIRHVLDQSSRTRVVTKPEHKAVTSEEMSHSPIRQYVAELQKKNRQKKEDSKGLEEKEIPVPSWRKSAQAFSLNQSIQRQEVVSSRPDHSEAVVAIQEKWEKDRLLENDKKQNSERKVKMIEVELPATNVTVAELSLLFRRKMTDITKCLENMGEVPNDDFLIGKFRLIGRTQTKRLCLM